MKCSKCNATIGSQDQFCGTCGHPVQIAEDATVAFRHCTNCGIELGPDDQFCGRCGHPAQARTTAPAAPPATSSRGMPAWLRASVGVLVVLVTVVVGTLAFVPSLRHRLLAGAGPVALATTATPTVVASETPAPTVTATGAATDARVSDTATVIPTVSATSMPAPTETETVSATAVAIQTATAAIIVTEPSTATSSPTATPFPEVSPAAPATPTPAPATVTPTGTPTPTLAAAPATMSLSGQIAFPVYQPTDGYYNVYVADADGSNRYLLADHRRQPEFSRDGRVVMNGEGGNTDSLWVFHADGSRQFEVGMHPEDSQPSWSPASDKIAMSSTLQGTDDDWRIYVYPTLSRSQEPTPLFYGSYEIRGRYPTWLADGRIMFTGCDYWAVGSVCGLYTVSAEGGRPTNVTRGDTNDLAADDFGTQLVYMGLDGGNWDIYRTTTSGGAPVNLTDHPARDGLPTWSPDGEWIAFVSDRGGVWAIWAMQPDGSNVQQLFDLDGTLGAEWMWERISWTP